MLVLADANFPAASTAAATPGGIINCDGTDIPTLLAAILQLMPLDETTPPCTLMGMMPEHKAAGWKTPIWATYAEIVNRESAAVGHPTPVQFAEVERFGFYDLAKKAYAVVSTGESALYGNLILTKGVIGSAK